MSRYKESTSTWAGTDGLRNRELVGNMCPVQNNNFFFLNTVWCHCDIVSFLENPHKRHVACSFGVSLVGSPSHLHSTLVAAMMCAISCYTGTCYTVFDCTWIPIVKVRQSWDNLIFIIIIIIIVYFPKNYTRHFHHRHNHSQGMHK